MTRMKSSKNIIKKIGKIMGTHKWSRGLDELPDGENTKLNALIEEWKPKIQHCNILLKSQLEDS